ncbi:C-type lectin domain family 4 member M-like [Heptranchias perlo]|uniref:C-type lectin domain family 4 member M-like n=1 Tax=Heptranchias perlo TaxID=212740 RepID=UPI003559B73E
MELDDTYQNVNDFSPDQLRGDKRKREDLKSEHGVGAAEPVQGKRSSLVIYILLGLSILLSMVILGAAFILFTQMFSEMKASVANFKMEFSQIKINITGMSEETRSSFAELRTEISQLKERLTEETRSSFAELGTEISQLKESLSRFLCPDQWRRFEQNCYYFSSSGTTWDEAQKSCTSMDANLLVINSAEEQVYLQGNLKSNHWIGLSDSVEEGNWSWVDGTDYASNVKFWESGQPNSNGDEGCVVAAANAAWHDWPCSSRHSSICKKPVQCYFP